MTQNHDHPSNIVRNTGTDCPSTPSWDPHKVQSFGEFIHHVHKISSYSRHTSTLHAKANFNVFKIQHMVSPWYPNANDVDHVSVEHREDKTFVGIATWMSDIKYQSNGKLETSIAQGAKIINYHKSKKDLGQVTNNLCWWSHPCSKWLASSHPLFSWEHIQIPKHTHACRTITMPLVY